MFWLNSMRHICILCSVLMSINPTRLLLLYCRWGAIIQHILHLTSSFPITHGSRALHDAPLQRTGVGRPQRAPRHLRPADQVLLPYSSVQYSSAPLLSIPCSSRSGELVVIVIHIYVCTSYNHII